VVRLRLRYLTRRISYDFRSRRRLRLRIAAVLLLGTIAVLAAAALLRLRPIAGELALTRVSDNVTLAVNRVVSEKMSSGGMDYGDLVKLEKDDAGNISALVTNMANINALQAEITTAVVDRLAGSDVTKVSIPLGSLIGGTLFSGRGPRISIETLSVANVSTGFRNKFTSAGINQTRHQIMLDVTVTMSILLAGYRESKDVVTEVSVAETVIVGSVPGTYAEFGGNE